MSGAGFRLLAGCAMAVACVTPAIGQGTAPVATSPQAPATIPAPTGPHRVGRVSFNLTDTSRAEEMTEEAGDFREVQLNIWHPAGGRGERARYIDLDPADPVFQRSYIYTHLGLDRLAGVRANAMADAPLLGGEDLYPVILFSHGLGMVSSLYAGLIEELASHGYVVVGVEHAYFSAPFRLSGRRVAGNRSRRPPNRVDATADEQAELVRIREEEAIVQARDLVFVVDRLERLEDDRFAGRLDLDRLGVFGHSRGGFAAPHACSLDPRFDACLNLDGYGLTGAVMRGGIDQPYMHIQEQAPWLPPLTDEELVAAGQTRAEADAEAAEAAHEFAETFGRMRGGAYVVTIAGAAHSSFSDAPGIAPERHPDIAIDATRATAISRAYILAFFDHYLRGRGSTLLAGDASFPEVTVDVFEAHEGSE